MTTPTPGPTPAPTPSEPTLAAPTRPRAGWRRPVVLVPLAIAAVAVLVVAMIVFQPWRLFVDEVVDEALPGASATAAPSAQASSPASGGAETPAATPAPAGPTVLATGTLISHEHPTSGSVALLELADGTRVIRFEGLDTDSGPDLRVWLSDQPVIDGVGGWKVFDDGDYLDLGGLKGNKGNQNYVVPAGTDFDDLTSVAIWCARFQVSFGAAELQAA